MAPQVNVAKAFNIDLPTPEPDSPRLTRKPYRFATLCATVEDPDHKDQYGSSSVPIYQTATFKGMGGEYDYTRSGNPTRTHLGRCQNYFHAISYFELFINSNRASSCKNILRPACVCSFFGDGRAGRNHPPSQTRRRSDCWR